MKEDLALSFPNPRLLTAVYFGLLSIIATFTVNTVILLLGTGPEFSMFKSIFWGVIVASSFGALFGHKIIRSAPPYYKYVFTLGFIMTLLAIPFYCLGFLYLLQENYYQTFFAHSSFKDIVNLYLLIIFYNFIFAGFFYAILAGFTAIYLRKYVVYFVANTKYHRHVPSKKLHKGEESNTYRRRN